LEQDESVAFVEPNGLVYQQGREHAPYGIAMTLGTSKTSQLFYANNFDMLLPQQSLSYIHGQQQQDDEETTGTTTTTTTGTLSRDYCPMTIGIVDGGLDVGHYDFEYCGVMETSGQADPTRTSSAIPQKCIGKAFLELTDMTMGSDWYNPTDIHGTHVAGVIGASARNGAGIRGMLSDEQLCLVLSRIFTSDGSSSVSKVVEAMLWTIEQGVQVLNLSLGTEIEYQSIKETVDYAEQQGILMIASAG
jgi:subtilisin family serine protease